MSRKRIKSLTEPENPIDALMLAPEIMEYPEEYVVNTPQGEEMYGGAIQSLTQRFERSSMKGDAAKLAQNSVHQIITFAAQLIPEDFNNQPVSIPELAAIFGAAIGMGAAPALDRGEVSIKEVEAQTDCFYVAMRQGVPGGILLARNVDKALRDKKFGNAVH